MAWDHLAIDKPHLVYIVLGGFTTIFMLCSSVIKERFYIGEATVATLCGIIFGPHAANLVDPGTWGNTDQVTLEFSRIVLVVQCFAVGVELPRAYMEKHWRSVVFLLVPVMTFGWLMTSLFIWGLLGSHLNWLDSLTCAACVTATDPVLASSVVGKGKFAKRVPKHLRDLLSAESGCNDGMAFPFVYLALYLVRYRPNAGEVSLNWFCITILYECVFGAVYGVLVGYIARRAIRYAHEKDLIDRESFLVFYFVLALFCAGSGSILGVDDLLVGFACGVGFSNDGWFTEKTEESHVSNVIDLLINLTFFVYFGTIIPWAQYNSAVIGTSPWRLVIIALLVLFFRRIPIMLMLKPVIPDIKTWREALFAGHFGPIGVGAIFVAILARADLETDTTTPLAQLPEPGFEHLNIIELIWPITTFLVLTSIIVHGSSIAVFTLGKHINTLTITMSYTQGNDKEASWMERLPRIQSRSKSQGLSMEKGGRSEESLPQYPDAVLPKNFLRRQKEEDPESRSSSTRPHQRRAWSKGFGAGGPVSESAIHPRPRREDTVSSSEQEKSESDTLATSGSEQHSPEAKSPGEESEMEVFEEGHDDVFEDEEGNVLEVMHSPGDETREERDRHIQREARRLHSSEQVEHGVSQKQTWHPEDKAKEDEEKREEEDERMQRQESKGQAEERPRPSQESKKPAAQRPRLGMMQRMSSMAVGFKDSYIQKPAGDKPVKKEEVPQARKNAPARAFRFGRTIIVEDEDGEVIKKYDIPAPEREKLDKKQGVGKNNVDSERTRMRLQRMGTWLGMGGGGAAEEGEPSASATRRRGKRAEGNDDGDDDNDDRVRFTVDGTARRMSKAEFIKQIQQLDPKARASIVEESDVPEKVKDEVRADAREQEEVERRASQGQLGKVAEAADKDGGGGGGAAIQRRGEADEQETGTDGLTLVTSNREEIPFHSVSQDLSRVGGSETPAQRRRRLAASNTGRRDAARRNGEPEGDEKPTRIVPTRKESTVATRQKSALDQGETPAERRRREGALGRSKEESDSEEDDDAPGRADKSTPATPSTPASPRLGIRFAEQPRRTDTEGSRASSIRWGEIKGTRHGFHK